MEAASRYDHKLLTGTLSINSNKVCETLSCFRPVNLHLRREDDTNIKLLSAQKWSIMLLNQLSHFHYT